MGKLEYHAAGPSLCGIVGARPPKYVVAPVTGAGDQVESTIPGEVDEGGADADARKRVIHQVRYPRALIGAAEPVQSVWTPGGDDELLHAVAVEVPHDAVHALGGTAFVDGVATEYGGFRHDSASSFFRE